MQLALTKLKTHLSHLRKEMLQVLPHLLCPAPMQVLSLMVLSYPSWSLNLWPNYNNGGKVG